jgi:hypothetical protein
MAPKSSVGVCRPNDHAQFGVIYSESQPDSVPAHPWYHSVHVIPGTIPAEFEFRLKFRWNCFTNLAGPSAKFDSSGIPGIARIPAGISGGQ